MSASDSKVESDVSTGDHSLPLAVDIGCSVSRAAMFVEGSAEVELIATASNATAIPSYVAFFPAHTGDGLKYRTVAGQEAKEQAVNNAKNTVFAWKRLLARKFSDPSVQHDKHLLPYQIVRGVDDDIFIQLSFCDSSGSAALVTPEEVQSIFLAYIRKLARIHLGQPIQRVVVGVPADFGFCARESVRGSALSAFMQPARLINEAAAIAVDYSTKLEKGADFNCLIVDVGAGKMDLCLVSIEDGVVEVKGTVGDYYFGGEDFTLRLMNYCAERFFEKMGYELKDGKALARLRLECERLKLVETHGPQTVTVPAIVEGINLSVSVPESFLQFLCERLYQHFLDLVEKLFQKSHITKEDVRQVLLCGCASKLPLFRLQLKQFFADVKDLQFPESVEEDAVVRGLAKEAAEMSGHGGAALKDALLIDVTPRALSVELADGSFLTIVPRCSTIPAMHIIHVQRLHRGQKAALIKIYESGGRPGLKRKLLGVCLLELVSVADYKKLAAAPSLTCTPTHKTASISNRSTPPHRASSATASSSASSSSSSSSSSLAIEDSAVTFAAEDSIAEPAESSAVAAGIDDRDSPPPLPNLEIRIDLTVGDEVTVRVREDHSDKTVTLRLSAESIRIAEAQCAAAHATYGHHLAVRATPAADA